MDWAVVKRIILFRQTCLKSGKEPKPHNNKNVFNGFSFSQTPVVAKCTSHNYGNQLLGWTPNSLLAEQTFIIVYCWLDCHLFHSRHSFVRIIKVFILVYYLPYFAFVCLESMNCLEYYETLYIFRLLVSTNFLIPKYLQRY